VVLRIKQQPLFFAIHPDGVEVFQAEPDGIDQRMAARTAFIRGVNSQTLAIGERASFAEYRQISIDAWRRRWYMLAKELLPHE